MPNPVTPLASVSVDRICQAFNYEWAETNPDTYWWWVRDIRLDPDEVIADDGEGGTWRVPFTTDGDFEVTFAEPVQVRETFVDLATQPAAAASAAAARVKQRVIARSLPRPSRKTNPAASRPDPQEGAMPTLTSEQFQALRGLPEDATPEQIQQVLAEQPAPDPAAPPAQPDPASPAPSDPAQPPADPAAPPADPSQPPADPAQPPAPADPAAPAQPATDPATPPAAPPSDPIAAAQHAALAETSARVAQLEAQATAREQAETRARRDSLATQWVQEGRIAPSDRSHYRDMLDIDEQRTTTLATALAAGRVPVAERGHDLDPAATQGAGSTTTGWFPQLVKEA